MRVLVCGGRDFTNVAYIWSKLDKLHAETPVTHVIHGAGGPEPKPGKPLIGADWIAAAWAKTVPSITRYVCPADWKKHGRAAGPIRNARMLEWKPDLVVAFPGGRGTADMVQRARASGVKVIEF